MQKKTIAAVVVIYNTRCEDSQTCLALADIKNRNIRVLIYDNSTEEMNNREFCEKMNWVYLGGTGNCGISRAYNVCIGYLQKNQPTDYICLFDDDTKIDESYFDMMLESAADSGGKIHVPIIYAGGRLLSPCLLSGGHLARQFADAEQALSYTGDKLSAINSCMAIDMEIFRDYRYDENIFLDGADHNFLKEMKARGEKLCVFPYRCEHEFSGLEHPSKEAAIKRFRIFKKDYSYILKNDKKAYLILVGKRALHLSLQYKTLEFFFVK